MPSLISLLFVLAVLGPVQAIRYLGRVNPATKELSWSATGVSFTFCGRSATIEFEALSGTNSAELIVDGKSTYIADVTGSSIATPANLTQGNHTIIFRKSSEALYGSIFLGNITTDGTFGPDLSLPGRRIEVIGDSITSGYGIGAALPCTNTAALEIISETYSVLTAEAVNADLSIISWSGIGLIRNYASDPVDTSPIMPERYTRYGANDPDNSYPFPTADTPDAIVINLGTNDFGHGNNLRPQLNGSDYTAAMVKFVQYLKASYKNNAAFFLLTSPMLNDGYPEGEMVKTTQRNALNEAVQQLNGTQAYVVDWPDQGSDVGCDYHPTPNTNEIGAKLLTDAIKGALRW
ncbi:carbohydrate esterase family 2 protein [Pleomassaria siparia CBS 279.74]|uniref:Carbohydrate esterase family 2 protein n=1 Tax=Pleomassaria siparia CBS 279.74 TaxID=1314801 RepID=A0A6G1KFI4_9PLEO|nr:carbohydrate esterase family 2 protein [Pleomassaria siparia CBS 279.74]